MTDPTLSEPHHDRCGWEPTRELDDHTVVASICICGPLRAAEHDLLARWAQGTVLSLAELTSLDTALHFRLSGIVADVATELRLDAEARGGWLKTRGPMYRAGYRDAREDALRVVLGHRIGDLTVLVDPQAG